MRTSWLFTKYKGRIEKFKEEGDSRSKRIISAWYALWKFWRKTASENLLCYKPLDIAKNKKYNGINVVLFDDLEIVWENIYNIKQNNIK